MKKLRIGVLGLGEGRSVICAVQRSDLWELGAICDLNEELCRTRIEEFGLDMGYTTSYEDMLRDDTLDVIGIYTPDQLHAKHIIMALEAGKHVVCTKPLMVDLSMAHQLLQAQEKSGKQVFIGQSSRYFEAAMRQRRDYENGEHGELVTVETQYVSDSRWFLERDWSHEKGFSWMYNFLIHAVDLAVWYLPKVETVYGVGVNSSNSSSKGIVVPDTLKFLLKDETGVCASVNGAYAVPALGTPTEHYISCTLRGTMGASKADCPFDYTHHFSKPGKFVHTSFENYDELSPYYYPFEPGHHHAGEYQNYYDYFARCIAQGETPLPDLKEGIRTIAVMEAMERSLHSGQVERVQDVLNEYGLTLQQGGMSMKHWEYGALRVSEDHRHLVNGDKPFFWLGDTAWLLCQTTTEEEVRMYLRNRRDKGFTVIQMVAVHTLPGEERSSLAAVEKDATTKEYWDYCSRVVKIAEELGLYIALLPSWGSVVKEGFINEGNIEEFITYVAGRFGSCPNIIWLLGGDIRGAGFETLYRKAGMLLRRLTPDKLIGFHPFGRTSTSLWFHNEEWLDFNMFQSGHRDYSQASLGAWDDNAERETFFGEDNWRYVNRDLAMEPPKPTVDGEPSYEWILHGLHDLAKPYWREWDVRRYAYWSVFQGAMGHTYGHNSVQQMYCNSLKPGSYGAHWTWRDAIHHVGAEQMGFVRQLMESVDWQKGRAAEHLLLSGQKEQHHRISVFAGDDFLFAYDYLGEKFTVSLALYAGKTLHAWWFNPSTGAYSYFADFTGKAEATVKPVARFTQDNDWVLVIRAE